MIRGLNNLVAVIIEVDFTLRLEWLENNSVTMAVLAAIYYVIVDVVPSIYLSLGIKIITHEYNQRKNASHILQTTAISSFTYDENSNIDRPAEIYEDSLETYIPPSESGRRTTINGDSGETASEEYGEGTSINP